MASIRPFAGLRYATCGGNLDCLTAPPYDVLSPDERAQYADRSPHNVVHLTLPEQKSDDRSKFIKYARSAALLAEWRREGVLKADSPPTIYRYRQRFVLPGFEPELCRTSIISLIKVEPYDRGVVLPHEQTFPKHKEDRLRILEATRSHLECIFGLYDDASQDVFRTVNGAETGESITTKSDDGVVHELEPICNGSSLDRLTRLFQDKKVWIADGHHRYETALAFRQALGDRSDPVAEDFMMMALCSISDPGLVLLPTHRVISGIGTDRTKLIEALETTFVLMPTPNESLMTAIEDEAKAGKRAFGLALPGGGFVLKVRADVDLNGLSEMTGSDSLKGLDVSVLHHVILEKLLNVTGLDRISYTREADEAVHAVEQPGNIAVLMNPPSVEDMKKVASAGEKMPQKSTYYFPKILSGLVMWQLSDF